MNIRTKFPHAIREIEHIWISLSDGTRLAARIWLPVDAQADPVPGILEYIPYRKNDFTALRDSIRHPYFAGHGYASVRVDMRGSGDSDGVLYDEYLPQEQDDALEVLTWIARQPWCSGAVGIIGKSWGGFNGLQIAARRPPELKAVISLCSTDDRYADDIHYMGSCLIGSEHLSWASTMLAYNARPPDPRIVGTSWREMRLERMASSPPFIEAWLNHQRRDDFWKHGSVCENYSDITCPVYAVGGWADSYTNAILRLLEGLPGPRKGLIGPWSHEYPEVGTPGPAIGFLQECLRWWDYWLKGIDTGIMDEPMLRAWIQDSVPPRTFYDMRPGHWVAEPSWPSPSIAHESYWFSDSTLNHAPAAEVSLTIKGTQNSGLYAGVWLPYGDPGDMSADQRAEDGQSLSFTSAPLDSRAEILGFPEVILTLAADGPLALVAVRLCDVASDGASTLVTWGLLNLTRRESHEHPTPLEPGQRYTVIVQLNAIAHTWPVGHRIRVSVSPTYWPHAWPSPQPITLTIFAGNGSRLVLPMRPQRVEDGDLEPFGPPEGCAPRAHQTLRPKKITRTVHRDLIQGDWQLVENRDDGHRRFRDNGLEYEAIVTNTYSIVEGDPLSASVRCDRVIKIGRGDWHTRIETTSRMTSDAERFHVTNVLDAYEANTRVFTKAWSSAVERDMV